MLNCSKVVFTFYLIYYLFNDTENVKDFTLYEAPEGVIRGFIISYKTARKSRRGICSETDQQLALQGNHKELCL